MTSSPSECDNDPEINTPEEALKELLEGNERFMQSVPLAYQSEQERTCFLQGQKPFAVILSCADSRVSPEIMFHQDLEKLFVTRVAGNIASTETIASIEYAVAKMPSVRLIVVVGHESCGAIDSALHGLELPSNYSHHLNMLLAHIDPAVKATSSMPDATDEEFKARREQTIRENAHLTAQRLRVSSSIIDGAKDRVKITSAYYHLVSGEVEFSELF